MYSRENIAYLKKVAGREKVEKFVHVLEVGEKPEGKDEKDFFRFRKQLEIMQEYGDNRWWKSDDAAVIVEHQLSERILLVPMRTLISAINVVLGTEISSSDELLEKLPELRKDLLAKMR